jgi:hypothetical protein
MAGGIDLPQGFQGGQGMEHIPEGTELDEENARLAGKMMGGHDH